MGAKTRTDSAGIIRWLLILIATALLSQTALNIIRPVTTYKLISFGSGSFTVGVVTAAYAILPLFTAMLLGRVSSRIRRIRFLMVAGVALLGLGGIGINFSPNALSVALASAALGLGHLMFTIGGQSSIARYFPDSDLDKGFGWFTAAFSAGQFAGPLIAGLVLGTGTSAVSAERMADISLSLWIGAGCSLLAIPFLLPSWQPRIAKTGATTRPAKSTASIPSILRVKGMTSHMFASMTLLAMLDILTAFLPLVAEKHGVTPAAVGVLLAIRGCASVISRLILPKLSTHFDRAHLLVTSLYVSGISIASTLR